MSEYQPGDYARSYFQEPEEFTPGYYRTTGEARPGPIVYLWTWDQWCEEVDNRYAKYGMHRVLVTDTDGE